MIYAELGLVQNLPRALNPTSLELLSRIDEEPYRPNCKTNWVIIVSIISWADTILYLFLQKSSKCEGDQSSGYTLHYT